MQPSVRDFHVGPSLPKHHHSTSSQKKKNHTNTSSSPASKEMFEEEMARKELTPSSSHHATAVVCSSLNEVGGNWSTEAMVMEFLTCCVKARGGPPLMQMRGQQT